MVTNPSPKEKRATVASRGLTAQNKKTLECVLGCCNHSVGSKNCLYWTKVVDCDDPASMQLKLITKLVGGK